MIQTYIYQVKECSPLSGSVSLIVLQAYAAHINYEAGQYIKIVHHDGTLSPLSISVAPTRPELIELHLSHAPDNHYAQDILSMIQSEGRLTVQGPFGSCTASRFLMDRPIIFLAAGTGFAPVKALVEQITTSEKYPPMHLYWCASSKAELYLYELPEYWSDVFEDFTYTFVLNRVAGTRPENTRKLQDAVLLDYSDLSGCQIYASGPENLVLDAMREFIQHGLVKERFYSDVLDYVK